MDRSEELRQTHGPPRPALLGCVERWLPFWEPQLVVACAIALQLSLSEEVTIGPNWLFPRLEGALLIGLVIVSPHPNVRSSRIRRRVAIGMIGLVSAANIASLVLLCHQLLHGGKQNGHSADPVRDRAVVHERAAVRAVVLGGRPGRPGGARDRARADFPDFMFVQMDKTQFAPKDWQPQLIDYLYVSFTNATAFSPTDTMPLTPIAKWLMSGQALASLVTVGLVVARAVNILS